MLDLARHIVEQKSGISNRKGLAHRRGEGSAEQRRQLDGRAARQPKSEKRPRRQREQATTSGSSVSFVTPCETDCFQRPTLPTLSSLMECGNRDIVEAQ